MNKTDAEDCIPIVAFDKLRPSQILKWLCQRKKVYIKRGEVLGSTYLGAGHYKALKGSITSCLFKLYRF
jgi:hypothetical protein